MIVKKTFGSLICAEISANYGNVLAYLSIPYAKGKRFEKSVLIDEYSEEIINSEKNFCFPQRSLHTGLNFFLKHHMMRDEWSVKGDIQSEDSFVVNIWTRQNPDNDPVLVFIHGSGDCNSGTTPIYNGANLASKGIVVITITYRIGNFGYLPVFDGLKLTANLAYYDQQLALKWIREHVSEFGGNERNITLMGHSGGALAVNSHYLNEVSSQYFDKCIICGGPVPRIKEDENLRNDYEEMLSANKCRNLEDLKSLDSKKIIKLKRAKMKEVLDGDFFREPSQEALNKKSFLPKPVLIGSNSDEFSMIELPMYYKFMGIARKAKNLDKALREHYGSYVEYLKEEFKSESADIIDLQIKILEALVFHNSVYNLMNIYSEKSPVYGYRMEYVPNLYKGLRGAYHGVEVALFFDNLDKMKIEITEENRKQTERLQRDWLSFIKTGKILSADTYNSSGKIILYRGTEAEMTDFPHADFFRSINKTDLPEKMMEKFLAGR